MRVRALATPQRGAPSCLIALVLASGNGHDTTTAEQDRSLPAVPLNSRRVRRTLLLQIVGKVLVLER